MRRDDLGRPSPDHTPGPEPKFWQGVVLVLIFVAIGLGAWYLWK
jgi:hypothetical protein